MFESRRIGSVEARKAFASAFYAWQGLGLLDLGPIESSGGVTRSFSQHYAEGWKQQFGRSDEPIGFVTRGWLAGAAAAVFDLPHGHFSTHQPACAAVSGGMESVFELRSDGANYLLFDGNGVDTLPPVSQCLLQQRGNVDTAAVEEVIATLPLFGSSAVDGGLIKSFDVLISWHPHHFYDRVGIECVRQAIARFGDDGRHAIEPLLEEAGHRCAFRTFGGIWRSSEWEAVVEPMCKTPEDWILGMIAVLNCAGWGALCRFVWTAEVYRAAEATAKGWGGKLFKRDSRR